MFVRWLSPSTAVMRAVFSVMTVLSAPRVATCRMPVLGAAPGEQHESKHKVKLVFSGGFQRPVTGQVTTCTVTSATRDQGSVFCGYFPSSECDLVSVTSDLLPVVQGHRMLGAHPTGITFAPRRLASWMLTAYHSLSETSTS